MRFVKIIMLGAATTVSAGLLLSTPAATPCADTPAEASKEIEKENPIVNAKAYSNICSDFVKAFEEDMNAASEHTLAINAQVASTPEVLQESLTDMPTNDDQKSDNPSADAASSGHDTNKAGSANTTKTNNSYKTTDGSTVQTTNNYETGTPEIVSNTVTADIGSSNFPAEVSSVNTGGKSASAAASNPSTSIGNTAVNSTDRKNSAATNSPKSSSAATSTNASENNAPASKTPDSSSYHHTTSIYTDDRSALMRVEYYDDNGSLVEYSDVTNYDMDTNSYTEEIYRYDEENNVEIPVRTDTYVNGELVSSESP